MRFDGKLEEISDGKLYDYNDMVKADTRGCVNCSACCHHMNETILVNPFDMYALITGLNLSYTQLMNQYLDVHYEDQIIMPHLRMVSEDEACVFLSDEGWCQIHNHRPNLCRLFPLGRYYEEDNFKYIFKQGDCIKNDLSKIKVKKWVNIENYETNKLFILSWFKLIKALRFRLKFVKDTEELAALNAYLIEQFYNIDWHEEDDFYEAFNQRLEEAKQHLGIIL